MSLFGMSRRALVRIIHGQRRRYNNMPSTAEPIKTSSNSRSDYTGFHLTRDITFYSALVLVLLWPRNEPLCNVTMKRTINKNITNKYENENEKEKEKEKEKDNEKEKEKDNEKEKEEGE